MNKSSCELSDDAIAKHLKCAIQKNPKKSLKIIMETIRNQNIKQIKFNSSAKEKRK